MRRSTNSQTVADTVVESGGSKFGHLIKSMSIFVLANPPHKRAELSWTDF